MKNTVNEKIVLEVNKRELIGKKAKKLRKQGLILANIFGENFKSQTISINFKDFIKIFKIVKETGIVYLKLDKEEIPCLINNIQYHPVNNSILHVDFRKIDFKKKIETEVPIKIINQSEAVTQKGGILLIQTKSLLIEALPENIPQQIEIDISVIKEISQEIKVSDLITSGKYQIKSSPDKVIVSVIAHKEESITPETTINQPEVITEKINENNNGEQSEKIKKENNEK